MIGSSQAQFDVGSGFRKHPQNVQKGSADIRKHTGGVLGANPVRQTSWGGGLDHPPKSVRNLGLISYIRPFNQISDPGALAQVSGTYQTVDAPQ